MYEELSISRRGLLRATVPALVALAGCSSSRSEKPARELMFLNTTEGAVKADVEISFREGTPYERSVTLPPNKVEQDTIIGTPKFVTVTRDGKETELQFDPESDCPASAPASAIVTFLFDRVVLSHSCVSQDR